jgi:hypothetical protein
LENLSRAVSGALGPGAPRQGRPPILRTWWRKIVNKPVDIQVDDLARLIGRRRRAC